MGASEDNERAFLRSLSVRAPGLQERSDYRPILLTPQLLVGAPRIELGPHAPEACILPLYYAPTLQAEAPIGVRFGVDLRGVEPRLRPCHGRVIPLYYRPEYSLARATSNLPRFEKNSKIT